MTNKRTLADWFLATRPWSYLASTMPVALVLAYYFADGVAVDPVNAVWALLNNSPLKREGFLRPSTDFSTRSDLA